jgi:hypothetical protein
LKIKDAREYFITLYQQLSALGDLKGANFTFTLSKNKEVLYQQLKKVQKMAKEAQKVEGYDKYEAARVLCNKEFSLLDDKGEVKVTNERYDIDPAKKEAYDTKLAALKEEYKDTLDNIESKKVELNEFVAEEIELELRPIPLSIVPADITLDQMDILLKLIAE